MNLRKDHLGEMRSRDGDDSGLGGPPIQETVSHHNIVCSDLIDFEARVLPECDIPERRRGGLFRA